MTKLLYGGGFGQNMKADKSAIRPTMQLDSRVFNPHEYCNIETFKI